jgi:hypothetical protein
MSKLCDGPRCVACEKDEALPDHQLCRECLKELARRENRGHVVSCCENWDSDVHDCNKSLGLDRD